MWVECAQARWNNTMCELGRVQTRARVVSQRWRWPMNLGQQSTREDGLIPRHVTWAPQPLRLRRVYEFFGNLIHQNLILLCECILPPQQDFETHWSKSSKVIVKFYYPQSTQPSAKPTHLVIGQWSVYLHLRPDTKVTCSIDQPAELW